MLIYNINLYIQQTASKKS